MSIKITEHPFEPFDELRHYQAQNAQFAGKYGATSIFIGTMRDFNEGDAIGGMLLEHYPGMTEKCIADALREAGQRWQILDSLVIHRVGEVIPNQPIVLVGIWTSHRGDAFDACRFVMETLKSTAPFWKKELLNQNDQVGEGTMENNNVTTRWVSSNSNGYAKKR